jgi:hypothetical protein
VRPSWMPRIAAAAAAVVVLGAGGLVLSSWNQQRGDSSDAAGGGAASSARSQPESRLEPQPTPQPGSGSASGGAATRDLGQVPGKRQMADPSRALPQLHRATLAADARALLERRPLLRTPAASPAPGTTDLYRGCPGPRGRDQAVTPVRYDGRTAALVVRAADADGQRVEVWTCDGDRRLAAATLSR